MSISRTTFIARPQESFAPVLGVSGSTEATSIALENMGTEPAFYAVVKRSSEDSDWQEHAMGGCSDDEATTFQLPPGTAATFRLPPSAYSWQLQLRSPAIVKPPVAVKAAIFKGVLSQLSGGEVQAADSLAMVRDSLRTDSAILVFVSGLSQAWTDVAAEDEAAFGDALARVENLAVGGSDLLQASAGSRPKLMNGLFADGATDFLLLPDSGLDSGGDFVMSVRINPFAGTGGVILSAGSDAVISLLANPLAVVVDGTTFTTSKVLEGASVVTLKRSGGDLSVTVDGELEGTYDVTGFEFGETVPVTLFDPDDPIRGIVEAAYVGSDPDAAAVVDSVLNNFPA